MGKTSGMPSPALRIPASATYRKAMESGEVSHIEDCYAPTQVVSRPSSIPREKGFPSLPGRDRRRIQQEKLLLSEKLAATGRLAATIAHEINNPLESVLNLIYLARTSRAEISRIREYLETAEKELTRVSHIARHTLGFYRETSLPADLDLLVLIEEVLTVYESRLRASSIEVRRDFTVVPTIRGLRGELHQVFSNLISNSIDAMREGGTLTVSVRQPEEAGNRGLVVAIRDTGMGIPRENIPRLFEPFFTTKPSAGTGLGLWVVRQFITSWGGTVDVHSETDSVRHGTAFTLFLPLVAVSEKRAVPDKVPARLS